MESTNITLVKALKGGAIAGAIAVGINNIWSLIAGAMGATIPPGFVVPVIMASIVPLLIGAVIFFALIKYAPKGDVIWLVVSIGFTLYSFYPVWNTAQLPDGTILDHTFPLLAGPMHAFSGFLGAWGIPRFSKY
jgi:hypothetical protein